MIREIGRCFELRNAAPLWGAKLGDLRGSSSSALLGSKFFFEAVCPLALEISRSPGLIWLMASEVEEKQEDRGEQGRKEWLQALAEIEFWAVVEHVGR